MGYSIGFMFKDTQKTNEIWPIGVPIKILFTDSHTRALTSYVLETTYLLTLYLPLKMPVLENFSIKLSTKVSHIGTYENESCQDKHRLMINGFNGLILSIGLKINLSSQVPRGTWPLVENTGLIFYLVKLRL